ncbi:mRNA cap methyltransferase [Paracoccidioides lutzii Pb01]|uniref:mRNA cap guanine-N(7) methyltransferase n=1 Tax=Paracoccidioides lutzii (strain ATCC MYA-826 / Pb01) TaxID=502779 RepID=C1HBQ7_PARBA|nr:mRNA cap methyltransferase [Paracoccidioides lutzii Pb01]EEH38471.2 mRNA cap methyltransferase [Paracoccidioides lutzii Pb01]
MAAHTPVDRRSASMTMYDPARDTYTVSDDAPPLDSVEDRHKVHGLDQDEQRNDGVLQSPGSAPSHNEKNKRSPINESFKLFLPLALGRGGTDPDLGLVCLRSPLFLHSSTPQEPIRGSLSKPERSFSSPSNNNINPLEHTHPTAAAASGKLIPSPPSSVLMGSSPVIANDELPINEQRPSQSPKTSPNQLTNNGHSNAPEGRPKGKASINEKKRKLSENEPQSDKTEPAPEQRPLSKRKRQEERLQKNRKRGKTPPSAYSRRDRSPTPPPRRSPSPIRRSASPDAVPRPRKRPGGAARIGSANLEALRRRQEERERQREEEAKLALKDRGVHDVVRQHYNAVPERGREWRKTDSRIKGLRSFNNWIKSTVIQKFSPDEDFLSRTSGKNWADAEPAEEKKLLVIDIGCGKGGDLGKWQQAPQPVDLYVGLDPAEVSIEQARERYISMKSGKGRIGRRGHPLFHAEFYPKDCFGEWVGDIPIVQRVGIDGSVGPGGSMMAARWGGGGFDIVVSMFSMHYAFESEGKARQMLHNVAGLLKKGGRFIGVGPNSDILSTKVVEFHEKKKQQEAATAAAAAKLDEGGEREDGEVEETPMTVPEWGNNIYRVRFPGETPEDGIFRPAFGWKYSYFMEEAVEEVPEYVVPWEAFRALTQDYNLELQYRKPFLDIWKEEKDDPILGPLSERMGVRARGGGLLLVTDEELEAASFYHAFCFYKV